MPRKNRAFHPGALGGIGPSVHTRVFPDAIIGSSVSHSVDEKKVVFAYQDVSLSEAVPSIFHCRGGFLLSGTVFPIMRINAVTPMHVLCASVSMPTYPLQRGRAEMRSAAALLLASRFPETWCFFVTCFH